MKINTNNEIKISVVLPCYNMEKYIEVTLKSLVYQDYDNLELIIIDGGSTDKTLEIIEKYKKYISVLISEPDKGQYDAINKGMKLATGDVYAWLNADDIYFPWTLRHVANFFNKYPDQVWISGASCTMDEKGLIHSLSRNIISKPQNYVKNGWFNSNLYGYLQQEGMFWKKELWQSSGEINELYKLAADFELWTRFSENAELVSFGIPLASFRIRNDSRSRLLEKKYIEEVQTICTKKRKVNFLVKKIGSYNTVTNTLLRKTTIKKGLIYYYSPLRKEWLLRKKWTTLSTHSWTSILSLN